MATASGQSVNLKYRSHMTASNIISSAVWQVMCTQSYDHVSSHVSSHVSGHDLICHICLLLVSMMRTQTLVSDIHKFFFCQLPCHPSISIFLFYNLNVSFTTHLFCSPCHPSNSAVREWHHELAGLIMLSELVVCLTRQITRRRRRWRTRVIYI